ncbi:flagellar motor switch protein FliG [Arthrobacter sp. AL08]|uniref:flagellar motor switch protein FliG n=1 Tax=unclassified Arthrobacter TaxID=235627 RepID=UPI001D000850|nr:MULTISPECIES: flagellar motor switch protein FliG [Micrococcaceae]MDI3242938.1 flagellar motor switch protein FliG [Arthrobacter sp. AL05]MDI3278992.1 flagellar motor switch protein FliG [Arthrobacter sp. AL08]MDJ0353355.1 flagellar motor switch protein FliG [Pseudarthrobacter sp. PH31-O2]WGZ79942.1 flagellar motor switch protein FliG [Arthrobacter sp. EM1]
MKTTVTLSGAQRAAVVLMQMNPANAALVMAKLTDSEAEEIAAEIVRLRKVDPDVTEQIMKDFHSSALSGPRSARGGRELAEGLLEASFGSEKAAGLINRLSVNMAGKSFEFLEDIEPVQILALIDGELPQTIALVLAHLSPKKASAVMSGLPGSLRADVALSIATMGSGAPEAIGIVAETLKLRGGAAVSQQASKVTGGIQPLLEIINRTDAGTERSVLDGLDLLNPDLATEIRAQMVTFEDIVKLDRKDVQQVLRGIDSSLLAIAMKGAPEVVLETITTNVSGRNLEILESEIAALGPLRASQIEEARAAVVRSIRELEADGSITIQRGDEEDFVY